MKNKEKYIFKDNYLINVIFVTLMTFFIEIIFKLISGYEIFDYSILRIFLSCSFLAIIITFISQFFKKRMIKNIINILYLTVYTVYAWCQLGFLNFLGVYISVNTSSQFGAVASYIKEFLASFKPIYYLMFIPLIISIVLIVLFSKKSLYKNIKFEKNTLLIPIFLIGIFIMYYGTITIPFMQNKYQIKSNKKLFINPSIPTLVVHEYGTTMFCFLDFKSFFFPVLDEVIDANGNAIQKEVEKDYKRDISDYLEQISENDDSKYTKLNNYFLSQNITSKNDYTGIFEGKNLVYILIESGSNALINDEYYPNFMEMFNNGWHWENSYSPRNSCATGNNEFSALTGLYSIYNMCTSNVYKQNTYFNSVFNLFNEKGYTTMSMHDFVNWYYDRDTIHKNMYSNAYYGANKLGIKTASYYGEWPSDIEFMEKAVDVIMENKEEGKPFMTFLTTVTGHTPYNESSTYGDLHMDYFVDEGYSKTTSRYLSKIKVTDEALGVLVKKLKEVGEFDNTVFVLFADHYPYALAQSNIKEFVSNDLSNYEIERTPFVIYSKDLTYNNFTEYTSYVNIVPTIANLFNLDYDPRLYSGSDLLSDDYESRVVFADGSWKNEKAFYNASTSKITFYTEEEYTPEEIQSINEMISLKMTTSTNAIKNNYFNHLENKLKELNLTIYNKEIVNEEVTNKTE